MDYNFFLHPQGSPLFHCANITYTERHHCGNQTEKPLITQIVAGPIKSVSKPPNPFVIGISPIEPRVTNHGQGRKSNSVGDGWY